MSNIFEYRTTRALQICIVFVTTLLLERLLNFSRAGWVGFVVMMIYVGFDAGASIHRTLHRFWGTILGLLLSYLIWKLALLDFRLLLIIIPVVVFLAFFSLCKFYAYPTIFTVTLTFLGTAYFSPSNYDAYYFFFDYFRATVVAFFICFLFEGWIFRNSGLTEKFYYDLQKSTLDELDHLYQIACHCPPNQNSFLKGSALCRVKINDLHTFEQTARHDLNLEQGLPHADAFHTLVSKTLHDIRLLFILSPRTIDSLNVSIQTNLQSLHHYLSQDAQ